MVKSCEKFAGARIIEKTNAYNMQDVVECKGAAQNRQFIVGAVSYDDAIHYAYYTWNISDDYQNPTVLENDTTNDSFKRNNFFFCDGTMLVYDDLIYMIGTSYVGANRSIITFDGSDFDYSVDAPQDYMFSPAVACDGKIHLFGGETDDTRHYTWQTGDSEWTLLSTPTPLNMKYGLAVVRQSSNHIHILKGTKHYELVNGSWVDKGTNPFNAVSTDYKIVSKGSNIHVFCGYNHYVWDGSSWINYGDSPISVDSYTFAILHNDAIVLVGGTYSARLAYYFTDY